MINLQVASEFQLKIQPECLKMSTELSKALKELANAIKNMTFPSQAVEIHIQNSKAAADEVKNIMENSSFPSKAYLQEILPTLVVASVLIDIIKFVENISVSVNELSQKAGFKKPEGSIATSDRQQTQVLRRGVVKPVDDDEGQVVIDIVEIKNPPPPTQG